ncbi:MAG: hypothetical protein IJ087_06390 [Eggerthellaceae bacterium]|nr:hypothetical protein [Eggerthellaceae bacterium]
MFGRKIVTVITSVVLVVSLCPAAAFASELQAGSATGQVAQAVSTQAVKNLEQRGVKFDLKNGKTVNTSRYLAGIGQQKWTAKLSGLKVSAADEDGFKKATFTVTFKVKKPLTKSQSKKFTKAWEALCDGVNSPWCWWGNVATSNRIVITDYVTGKSLYAADNAAKVTIGGGWEHSKWKTYYVKMKKYPNDGKIGFRFAGVSKCNVSITFPENYENLCVGVGGDVNPKYAKGDSGYTSSPYSEPYWKTSWFKKASKGFHFIRIG